MFDQYSEIFDARGSLYHQAMAEQPAARAEEFAQILAIAKLERDMSVLDIPSGGGYLFDFIDCRTDFTQVETSSAFYEFAKRNQRAASLYCDDIASLPLAAEQADRVISLAGLHHIEDRRPFYREARRLLSASGLLCIADVAEGSAADGFLNQFVDQNSSAGHAGLFISARDIEQIEQAGFSIQHSEVIDYTWSFASVDAMVDYCKKMFGIDQCSEADVLVGIKAHLGYRQEADRVLMNWSLHFIRAACAESELGLDAGLETGSGARSGSGIAHDKAQDNAHDNTQDLDIGLDKGLHKGLHKDMDQDTHLSIESTIGRPNV